MDSPDRLTPIINVISSGIKLATTWVEFRIKRESRKRTLDSQGTNLHQGEKGRPTGGRSCLDRGAGCERAVEGSQNPFGRFDLKAPVGSKEWLVKFAAEAEYAGEELEIEVEDDE